MENLSRGSLFAGDVLCDTVVESDEWRAFDDAALESDLAAILARFPTAGAPNESQTEDDLIWPILKRLGWAHSLRQQNLSATGRDDVPDGLLFADAATKTRANGLAEEWRRYPLGLALVESKRWRRPLDRHGEETPPSTQMLRYLRRADDLTAGRLRWGILTNGACWRLYWQGARSVSEQFFELDLAALLARPGDLLAPPPEERRHWLKLFALIFRHRAFLPGADGASFHRRAIDEGRFHEERIAGDLATRVFEQVFPRLADAIADAAPEAPLDRVRDAALFFLYRLLFILYAEDRGLLPIHDRRYSDNYALRRKVRVEIARRMDENDTFSTANTQYWSAIDNLCRAIDAGDPSIGLPPYDGGLFDRARAPLLNDIRLGDNVVAAIVAALSFRDTPTGRRYIDYRDLGVRQLGSIYERLLEQTLVREHGALAIRPDPFARKTSGSYYTPDELVRLILDETLGPLAERSLAAFRRRARELDGRDAPQRLAQLERIDPAERLLELKLCDPAMGSGHFLVDAVDWLADRAIAAMAEAEAIAGPGWRSPLTRRIADIRATILAHAEAQGWALDPARLDDRHIVRRMVLKRCVYGVDKNPMAVELAKVSLWLHSFTVGAPLSFLDHHLRCGDSLFGSWVRGAIDKAARHGTPLLLHDSIKQAAKAAQGMATIEKLTDAEIDEAHRSAATFAEVQQETAPLDRILTLVCAFDRLDATGTPDRQALQAFFGGQLGDPVAIATGKEAPRQERAEGRRFAALLARARDLAAQERFLNWQAAFPGVWTAWENTHPRGGFDAVIGNPPWDRVKLQQVEWFAARRPAIAHAHRAADRRRMIAALEQANDPLHRDYLAASQSAAAAARMARTGGDYPLLSAGDINLYSLFVERAMALLKPEGLVGLLVPSGIASDKTAARFFQGVATAGRLRALYDFENGRRGTKHGPYFPDVHRSFKFSVFVAGPQPAERPAQCAFFLQSASELADPERRFPMTAADFARVNPNTGTAPIFRSRRDARLTTAIYDCLPVLVNRSSGAALKTWPVRYATMFHMANDSGLFRTRAELEEKEGAWPIANNRFASPSGEWLPLYEGKMVQAFDHRAADVVVKEGNLFRPGQQENIEDRKKQNPDYFANPRYYVMNDPKRWNWIDRWSVAFKDITATTNMRTMIAAIVPQVGAGHTLPLLPLENDAAERATLACLIVANLNATVFDFVARQKVPTTHFTWYVLEQLPVIPPERFHTTHFGPKTAGEIVREAVLELTYTAHDMAPFARDLGHIDPTGAVLPPFPWNERRRLHLRAKLDALFFHLYGITNRDDIRHIYSTFPIVERQETATHAHYRSRTLCLAWLNALAAGEPDAEVEG